VLIILVFALFYAFPGDNQCYTYIGIIFLFLTLQEKIDTVTVEGVENVGEDDCIGIKTEEDYIQLVGRVKCEQEVSVLCCVFCGRDLFTDVCVCCVVLCVLLRTILSPVYYIFLVSACESAGCKKKQSHHSPAQALGFPGG
jgi:hypothetical protein